MSGMFAKTYHPIYAIVSYIIILQIVIAGLIQSSDDMFVVLGTPTCMDGTTSNPYASSTGPKWPGAPNANSVPFCSSDALLNAYPTQFNTYGYIGTTAGSTDSFTSTAAFSSQLYCFKQSNGTCPTLEEQGANSITVIASQTLDGTFQVTDSNKFTQAFPGNPSSMHFFSFYNNAPITLAGNLPGGVDASKTYYIRNLDLSTLTFNVATDTTSVPLAKFTSTPTNSITVTFPNLGSCASQQNVMPASGNNPANINADGTLKTGSCGYCLTQPQQIGWRAVPGLCITTIVLLIILVLLMCVSSVRTKGFFRILFIVVSVLCLIFLIAAVSGAAATFSSVSRCYQQTDFSVAQMMPAPTAKAFSGYTPSSGGIQLLPGSGQGNYNAVQSGNAAAYVNPFIAPSSGAVSLIIAIVFLFIDLIFFAIKTDWTSPDPTTSSADSGSATMMTPR
jgi:hypothetical protein